MKSGADQLNVPRTAIPSYTQLLNHIRLITELCAAVLNWATVYYMFPYITY